MLSGPRRREILPQRIREKIWACLATRFNVHKNVVRTVVKLDQEINQFGKVRRLQGGDLMTSCHFVNKSEDTRDASFVRVEYRPLSVYAIFDHSYVVHSICRSTCATQE
jgi:hypothetical protein